MVRDMEVVDPIVMALDRAGFRLTAPRRTLAGLITEHEGSFTANDLLAECRRRHLRVGRATVFRTIDALSELGVVERLDLPSGEHAFVVCRPAHHHHVVCSLCGRATDIDDRGLRSVVRDIARRSGYRIDDHRLELFGLCPACIAAQGVPTSATA